MTDNVRRSTAGPDSSKPLGESVSPVVRLTAGQWRSLETTERSGKTSGIGSSGLFTKKGADFRQKTKQNESVKSGNKVRAQKKGKVVADAVKDDLSKLKGQIDDLTNQLNDILSVEGQLALDKRRIDMELMVKQARVDWFISQAQDRASTPLQKSSTIPVLAPRRIVKICDLEDTLIDSAMSTFLWRLLPLLIVALFFSFVSWSSESSLEVITIRQYSHSWCTIKGVQTPSWKFALFYALFPCESFGPIFIPGYVLLPLMMLYLIYITIELLRTPSFLKTDLVLYCDRAHKSVVDNRPEFDKDNLPLENLYIDCRVALRVNGEVKPDYTERDMARLYKHLDKRWFDVDCESIKFRSLRLHEGLLSIALNRRTLKQSKAAQKVSFERAVRLMEAENRFCEDYDRLFDTGESVYRHMEQVLASIISNDQATDLLDF